VIYRIITESRMVQGEYDPEQGEFVWQWVVPKAREDRVMTGAGQCFGNIMFARGLRAPLIQNPRARFYFTERGWDKVGRFVASDARKKGFLMRVIRRKNPPASQIVYQDDFQIALLHSNRMKQMGRDRNSVLIR
jgi:hypothetical protein